MDAATITNKSDYTSTPAVLQNRSQFAKQPIVNNL